MYSVILVTGMGQADILREAEAGEGSDTLRHSQTLSLQSLLKVSVCCPARESCGAGRSPKIAEIPKEAPGEGSGATPSESEKWTISAVVYLERIWVQTPRFIFVGQQYSPRFAWGGRPHRRFISVRERG